MLGSFLMGLVGGQRAMMPLAAVAVAAARHQLHDDNGAPRILTYQIIAAGALALAVAEMAGDKQKTAPDRMIPIGLAARFVTSGIAGAALVPRRQRWLGAAVGSLTAVVASYPGWRLRMASMSEFSQSRTGFVEDAVVLASAVAIVRAHRKATASNWQL